MNDVIIITSHFRQSKKALNIQVHNPVPVVESSPSPAWEPEDPFNELANRPKEKVRDYDVIVT